ncbi:tripartite tricarboxylate transporter substrate binding protein [Pigmentiphaga sp.]|uniref:Bug family tripartite tricarboxylate transporter substrate binding protein n=1 Tax=Pigmentiphaga sp. TaxID=1977564 RepID=UPI00128E7BD6|nr:tripartite tricarboxylate transporter substrate binding protein [Pigmentiphaga sp.]MPS25678.1 tripartite tricarboxylate transporter substrate binding protein [Alcaligenaceae bacterium SAGV5]MPS54504.1 tripartite tricarboxylate transporter substrate binding protein [Alcaligenaceae bacterium SAGV3]MPT58644.1 tripartite tricarboxylate transporter substrate binding protein [Alcaligenaceae bacterium]
MKPLQQWLRRVPLGLAAAAIAAGPAAALAADAWPSRPVTIVVPFAPGGNTDMMARMMAERMSKVFGKPFIVDNKGGAAGTIAAEQVSRAQPDGYTLFMATMTQIVTAPMTNKIRYDPIRDLAPIINVGGNPFVLAVNPQRNFRTVTDLVNYAKANPGKLNVGHGGNGTLTHLSALLFLSRVGVTATTVPYRGGAPALADVLAGQIDMYSASVSEVMSYAKTPEKLTLLAVSSDKRLPQLPSVPTIAETYPGHEVDTWNGLMGPAGMPADVVARLAEEGRKMINEPSFRAQLENAGITPLGEMPDAFAARIKAETAKWKPVIQAAGIEPQ